MANKKIAINGLGRIGRHVFKQSLEQEMDIVAVNDLASPEELAYLLNHDSVYQGGINYKKKVKKVTHGKDFIKIGRKKIKVLNEKDPEKLPWKSLGVDAVVESTGLFRDREDASKHLKAGAKKVVISAPAKKPDKTIVPGVNDKDLKPKDEIISVASCTTNCMAPVTKVINDKFGIKKGLMTTVHAYTSSQSILDGPHKKIRRGRAAAENIVPTSTGAAEAVTEVLPELKGRLDGMAMRVPVPTGSIVDFTAELKEPVSVEKVNKELEKQSGEKMKDIIEYSDEELVSSDIIDNRHSSIVDSKQTMSIGKNMIKVLIWYDNEAGYSARLVDVLKMLK